MNPFADHCQLCYGAIPAEQRQPLQHYNDDGSVGSLQVCPDCRASVLTNRRRGLGATLDTLPPGPKLDALVERVLLGKKSVQ